MDAVATIEGRRLAIQATLDEAKTQADRNKLGQFATPTGLASDMLAFAKRLLPPKAPVRFLDPAIGTGSFYSALVREFPRRRIEVARGFEIDPHYNEPAREIWSDFPLEITPGDFTKAKPPKKGEGFNLVICNPPYVRHHHIDKAVKVNLRGSTTAASGIEMAGLAGLYCYFLGLTHPWMEPKGIAGWLIPSEFMDVNYGVPVKRYLLNEVELIRIHRFDPSELQFGDALVSSAVVWFRNRKPQLGHQVEFSYGGTLAEPKVSRLVTLSDLKANAKWTSLAADGVRQVADGWRLADFFEIKRGLATGDNGFFFMTRDQIAARDLPMKFFKPILPGPRHLESDIVEAESDGTPRLARQLFMLDCRLPEVKVKECYPALWAYLQTGKRTVAETYLCSRRSPWYAQENRPPPPFICTYMGRNMAKRDKPFRFILNRSQATAANVYLLLYPKPMLAKALLANPSLSQQIWEFLNGIEAETLLGEGRVYGGGLYKMEPKELANVAAKVIANLLSIDEPGPAVQMEMFSGREIA